MKFTTKMFIAFNRERLLELREREAFQSGDFRAYHIPEGGVYQISEWTRNAWTGQGFWQITDHLTESEIRRVRNV